MIYSTVLLHDVCYFTISYFIHVHGIPEHQHEENIYKLFIDMTQKILRTWNLTFLVLSIATYSKFSILNLKAAIGTRYVISSRLLALYNSVQCLETLCFS